MSALGRKRTFVLGRLSVRRRQMSLWASAARTDRQKFVQGRNRSPRETGLRQTTSASLRPGLPAMTSEITLGTFPVSLTETDAPVSEMSRKVQSTVLPPYARLADHCTQVRDEPRQSGIPTCHCKSDFITRILSIVPPLSELRAPLRLCGRRMYSTIGLPNRW